MEPEEESDGSRAERPLVLLLWVGWVNWFRPLLRLFVHSLDEGVGGIVHGSRPHSQLCSTAFSRMTFCVPTKDAAFFNESIHSVGFLCLNVCTPNCPCCQCSAGSLSYQPRECKTGSSVIFFRLQTLCRNRKDSALFQVSQQGDAVIQTPMQSPVSSPCTL